MRLIVGFILGLMLAGTATMAWDNPNNSPFWVPPLDQFGRDMDQHERDRAQFKMQKRMLDLQQEQNDLLRSRRKPC